MWKPADAIMLTPLDRQTLGAWSRARTTPHRLSLRARIVLGAAEGQANSQIARALHTSRPTVLLWRQRFATGGVSALQKDTPGRGRRPTIPPQTVRRSSGRRPRPPPGARPIGARGRWRRPTG